MSEQEVLRKIVHKLISRSQVPNDSKTITAPNSNIHYNIAEV